VVIENNNSLEALRAKVNEHWDMLQERLKLAQQLGA
jgi:hypothetical protein